MVCLVNVRTQGDSDIGKQLTDISREAKDFIEHNFKIALSISISCVHEKAEGIKTAYQEAMKGIEYKILFGSGGIIPYDSIRHTDSGYHMGGKSLALQQEQLANCIKARSYKEAKAIINEIIDSHITGAYPPIDLLKIRMFGLLNDIITAFEDSIPYIAEDFAKEINIYERMINCRTLPELREETNKIFDEMDTYLQDRQRSDAEELIHQIKQRVYTDFHDPNLCVSTIASHFSLNVSYLSKFYKEQTGEGLLEYIQKFRTEKAKGMLDGSLNIKEISKKVGYENPDTFIRLFKKHEGITPGRYRRIRQE